MITNELILKAYANTDDKAYDYTVTSPTENYDSFHNGCLSKCAWFKQKLISWIYGIIIDYALFLYN